MPQLIQSALAYDTPERLKALLDFTRKLPAYSPFNCLLLHIQKPDALYVAPITKWRKLNRHIKPGARPLLILAPMHPVMFVFDVTDTEGPELPLVVQQSLDAGFSVGGVVSASIWKRLLYQCQRGGIQVKTIPMPTTQAGHIRHVSGGFQVQLNAAHTQTQQFVTLVHELGHLFCGHLGDVVAGAGPTRSMALALSTRELEAEAVAWIVCQRSQLLPGSAHYLSGYLKRSTELPAFSLEAILVAAGCVEQMIKGRMPRWLRQSQSIPSER